MKPIFTYYHHLNANRMGAEFIYYDNGIFVRRGGASDGYQMQWRYRNGNIEWKHEIQRGWVVDNSRVLLAYKAYLASLILENKE